MRRPPEGPWLSTAHSEQHRPGGGDEIDAADIGAAPLDHAHDASTGAAEGGDVAALRAEVAALRADLNAHRTAKAGVAHR